MNRIAGKGKHEQFSEQVRKEFNIHIIDSYGGKISWAEELNKYDPDDSDDGINKVFAAKYNKMIERANYDLNITHNIRKTVSFRLRNDECDAITFLNDIRTNTYILINKFFKLI